MRKKSGGSRRTRAFLFAVLLGGCGLAWGESVWVEGENADRKTVHPHPWYDSVKKAELSGGAWLSNFAEGEDNKATAEYDVTIPADGRYTLWLRANPVKSRLSLKVGEGKWNQLNTEDGWRERVNVAADGKLDLRFVAWKKVGLFDLKAGKVTVAFRIDSANSNHGAIDAFVLTTDLWKPSGILKPGETPADADAGTDDDGRTWAFRYAGDTLRQGSPIDLRRLNETVAGEKGFITRTKEGSDFADANGDPMRFWAVGTGGGRLDDDELARHARFLAKLGVNMVRFHGSFSPKEKGAKITQANEKEMDRCRRVVAAMKKEGIYTTISPFWANAGFSGAQASWGLEGYGDGEDVWGLLFFNHSLKAAYKEWMRRLYTEPNPHTGVPLAREPAVALIQIQNEDSLFFYTMQGIKEPQKALLEQKFSAWLEQEHGSVKRAVKSWDEFTVKEDDLASDRAAIIPVWDMTQPQTGGKAKRLTDQTRFLGELQRGFYREMRDFYRDELGCQQLINACNWKSASETRLGDLERWTYSVGDVIAVNRYYNGGAHIGPDNGWRINPGDFFQSKSATKNPLALPLALKQTAGMPMIITESTWVHPLGYQSEGPFLIMAYQSLTGIDAYYWFSHDGAEYNLEPYHSYTRVSGQYGMRKWGLPPAIETMFPAAALAYRMGYVQQGKPVLRESRSLQDLWERKVPVIAEGARFDPNRDTTFEEGKAAQTTADPALFLKGPVVVDFAGGSPQNAASTPATTRAARTIDSVTGQIALDYHTGLCTVNAPKAQGATGFLRQAGPIRLSSLLIDSQNEYATVLAVSLDGQPLATSQRVLLQCGTRMRPSGWQTQPATRDGSTGEQVVNTGHMPWRVEANQTTLLLKSAALTKATALDTAGFPRGEIPLERTGSAVKLTFPRDTVWVVLE